MVHPYRTILASSDWWIRDVKDIPFVDKADIGR